MSQAQPLGALRSSSPLTSLVGSIRGQDRDQRIEAILIKNLTTNDPLVNTILDRQVVCLPKVTVWDKIALFKTHLGTHYQGYKDVLVSIAIIAVTSVVSVLIARYISGSLDLLYAQILRGEVTFVQDGYRWTGTVFNYYETAFGYWFLYAMFVGPLALTAIALQISDMSKKIVELKDSWLKFYANPTQLVCTSQLLSSSYPLTDQDKLSNDDDREGSCVKDPILLIPIQKGWSHAPRFIKVGQYLCLFHSILKSILRKPLHEGKIYHPIENRLLNESEKEKLITDLTQLLAIEKDQLLKYWDPFYCSLDKLPFYQHSEILSLEEGSAQRAARLEELVFDEHLERMFGDWKSYQPHQKAGIRYQIKDDYFASLRLQNFLRELPDSVLDLEIKSSEQDTFTLRTLYNQEKKREYHCDVPS